VETFARKRGIIALGQPAQDFRWLAAGWAAQLRWGSAKWVASQWLQAAAEKAPGLRMP